MVTARKSLGKIRYTKRIQGSRCRLQMKLQCALDDDNRGKRNLSCDGEGSLLDHQGSEVGAMKLLFCCVLLATLEEII